MENLLKIDSIEGLQLEKLRMKGEIERSMTQLREDAQRTVLPKDASLMQSPLRVVRYAAYGITAYKTYNAIMVLMKMLGRQKKISN